MKAIYRGFRITWLVLLLTVAILLSSCSFFQSFTVDSLIRPPKLTGENALIEQAFESAVQAEVMFISPIAGDYRTAFVQYDVDVDGTDETLVFYAKKDSPNEAHMHLLKYDGSEWYSAGDITGNGSEVYSVAFYHFDPDVSFEVAVCWTVSDSRRNKTLSLYKLNENEHAQEISQLSVIQLFDYLILDFDMDGQLELMYLMDNSSDSEQPFKISMIKMDPADGAFHFVCELPLHQSVNLPVRMTYDVRMHVHTLYIDCVNFDGSYITEILYYDNDKSVFSRLQNEEGTELSELTVRNSQVYCSDINNDKNIEVPLQKVWEGSSVIYPEAESPVPMHVIEYAKLHENEMVSLGVSYFYAPDGTFRFRTEMFKDAYIAVYEQAESTVRFYVPDEPDTCFLSVQFVPLAAKEAAFNVEFVEPEVALFTEKSIRQMFEIL